MRSTHYLVLGMGMGLRMDLGVDLVLGVGLVSRYGSESANGSNSACVGLVLRTGVRQKLVN